MTHLHPAESGFDYDGGPTLHGRCQRNPGTGTDSQLRSDRGSSSLDHADPEIPGPKLTKEMTMSMTSALLPEFDREMATTRRLLERVPEQDAAWKPHDKSMSLGQLAIHIGHIPAYGALALLHDEFDAAGSPRPQFTTTAALVDAFDDNVRQTREALAAATGDQLMQPWTFRSGDSVVFTMPRAAVLRTLLFSHIIHHRGQLSVYLRLRDVPLPSIYGPSADEQ